MRSLGALLTVAAVASGAFADDDPLARAERLLARRDFPTAEAALRQLARAQPESARVHGNLALALLPQGKIKEAVHEGRLAAAFGPEVPEARYIYGLALEADRRPVEAAREFERALALKPGAAGPLRALAAAYAELDDPQTADTYRRLIALEPRHPSHRADLAEYLWRTDQTKEGDRVMDEAVRAFPTDAGIALRFGRALFEQERYLDAVASLESARAAGATDGATARLLANAYWQAGRTDSALETFEAAGKNGPPSAQLEHDHGRLLLSGGRADAALPHLEKAARLEASAPDVRLDLGRAYETLGRLPEAEACYRRAVQLAPNSPRAHYVLGRILVRQGKREEGDRELAIHRTQYERARQMVSDSVARSGELALAWSQLNQGDSSGALVRFASLPESSDSLLGQATALSRLARHRDAVAVLERARRLDPENRRVDVLLAAERSSAEAEK